MRQMEIISTKLNHNLNIDHYFKGLNSCFIDIETTGLDRNRQIIYLIGLLFYDQEKACWVLNQYFSKSENTEKALLESFLRDLSGFNNIITYNGDSFDLPFINHRSSLYNIDSRISLDESYDLYRLIRKNKDFLSLENLQLKTVEKSLGYHRDDIYSGYDCIAFYYDYLKTRDPVLKERVLSHNRDDLFYMLDIIEIIDIIHSKKTIPIDSTYKFTIDNIHVEKDILYIKGSFNQALRENIKFFSKKYNINTSNYKDLKLSIDINYGYVAKDKKAIYIDALDYRDFNLSNSSDYKIPDNIFILKVEKTLYLDNIKSFIKEILKIYI